jgi:hypothetical protein
MSNKVNRSTLKITTIPKEINMTPGLFLSLIVVLFVYYMIECADIEARIAHKAIAFSLSLIVMVSFFNNWKSCKLEFSEEYFQEYISELTSSQKIYLKSICKQEEEIAKTEKWYQENKDRWGYIEKPSTWTNQEVIKDAKRRLLRTTNKKAKILQVGFLVGTPLYNKLLLAEN